MEATPLSRAISVILILMLGSVFALFLIVDWRYRKRIVLRAFGLLQLIHLAVFVLLLYIFGPTAPIRILFGTVPVIIYNLAFFHLGLSHYRDGRIIFSIITVQLLSCIGSALCSMLAPYGSPFWSLCWILFVLGTSLLLYFYCRSKIQAMMHSAHTGWFWLSLIPASLLMYLYALYVYPVFVLKQDHFHRWSVLSVCAASMLIYVGIYQFSKAIEQQHIIKRDADQLHSQMRVLEQQIKYWEVSEQKVKGYYHDQRHYIRLLNSILSSGDIGSAVQVLEHLDHVLLTAAAPSTPHYTEDAVIDAALHLGCQRAVSIGVDYRIQMQFSKDNAADRPEFALILLNALENALNACEKIPPGRERWLEVLGIEKEHQYLLSICNTYYGPVRLDSVTTFPLPHQSDHGYGTRSIVNFAEKHNGSLKYSAADGIFSLRLLFSFSPQEPPAAPCAHDPSLNETA